MELAQPVIMEPALPAMESAHPVNYMEQLAQPVGSALPANAMEPAQPTMEPAQPAVEPAQPAMEPDQPAMEPPRHYGVSPAYGISPDSYGT